jgi:ankyrin repeat protein
MPATADNIGQKINFFKCYALLLALNVICSCGQKRRRVIMRKYHTVMGVLVFLLAVPWTHLTAGEIHDAARNGDSMKIKNLLKQDPQAVRQTVGDGITPLHIAAQYSQKSAVEQLIMSGANVNDKDFFKLTPLHYVAASEVKKSEVQTQIAALLLNNGAEINAKDFGGKTPLIYAVNNVHIKLVTFLIENGADANMTDKDGTSVLCYAVNARAVREREEIVNQLLKAGAYINKKGIKGWTPLHYLAKKKELPKYIDTSRLDDKKYMDDLFDATFPDLFIAAQKSLAYLLLSKGASLEIKNDAGKTPIDIASESGNVEILEFFKFYRGNKP